MRMWVHKKKTPLLIQFIYLGYKEIYVIFEAFCIISVLFSKKVIYFVILSFSV
jgi:hypothetical protein